MRAVAKSLRRRQTTIEDHVWREFRAKRLDGVKFKRQVPIGPFIADFVCFSRRLVVEVDGPRHERPEQARRDKARDDWFARQGFAVLRISGEEAIAGLDRALERIARHLNPPLGRDRSVYRDQERARAAASSPGRRVKP